jgi:hypothetical protein
MASEEEFIKLLGSLRASSEPGAGASEEEIARANGRLPQPIPLRWYQVLRVRNGGEIRPRPYVKFTLWSAERLETSANGSTDQLRALNPPHLIIGEEPEYGDWLTLDIAQQSGDGDCPVRWLSADGDGSPGESWESIAAFLHWWLEGKA